MIMSCCTPENTNPDSRLHKQLVKADHLTSTDNMVLLSEGSFTMGTNSNIGFPNDGEGPEKKINLNRFRIDRYAVTNSDFERFTTDTNYKTEDSDPIDSLLNSDTLSRHVSSKGSKKTEHNEVEESIT